MLSLKAVGQVTLRDAIVDRSVVLLIKIPRRYPLEVLIFQVAKNVAATE